MLKTNIPVDPYLIDDFLEVLREIEGDALFVHESVQFLRLRLNQVARDHHMPS